MNLKTNTLILTAASLAVLLTGCQNPDGTQNNTGSGALIGGALGAITGAAIGGRNHGGQDALIGAAAGVVAGGLVGNSMDREQDARLKAQTPPAYISETPVQPLSVADVKALAKAGLSDDTIITQINSSHTVYHLAASDIVDLHNAGVSDNVVNYMINTPSTAGNPAVAPASSMVIEQAPPPPPADLVLAAPGPDYVWVAGEYEWNGRWIWVGGHWGFPPHPHAVWVAGRAWRDRYGWHHERGYWR